VGLLTYILLGLLATFWAGDAVAHFTRYKYGETVSAAIWWLEKRSILFRILVGLSVAVLFTHLEFQIP